MFTESSTKAIRRILGLLFPCACFAANAVSCDSVSGYYPIELKYNFVIINKNYLENSGCFIHASFGAYPESPISKLKNFSVIYEPNPNANILKSIFGGQLVAVLINGQPDQYSSGFFPDELPVVLLNKESSLSKISTDLAINIFKKNSINDLNYIYATSFLDQVNISRNIRSKHVVITSNVIYNHYFKNGYLIPSQNNVRFGYALRINSAPNAIDSAINKYIQFIRSSRFVGDALVDYDRH